MCTKSFVKCIILEFAAFPTISLRVLLIKGCEDTRLYSLTLNHTIPTFNDFENETF